MNPPNSNASAANAKLTAQIKKMGEVALFDHHELKQKKIVYADSENREMLKVCREMRTRIYTVSSQKNMVCLITSVAPRGGASFIARNLAATITMDATKTALLVDCNLYAPSCETLLPVDPRVGLTDFLDDEMLGVDDIVYASGIPRLRVVPVGNNRDGGTEKIMTERMKGFVRDIKHRYTDRVIILDGPSVGEYDAEIRILAEFCDLVLLVVPDDLVTEVQINESIHSIGREKIFGIVSNKIKF